MFGQAVGATVAFAVAHTQVRPFGVPATSLRLRTASAGAVREVLPGGGVTILAPFVVMAAAAVFLYLNTDRLPAQWPVHRGADGLPDRWVDRTWRHVYGPLMMGAIVAVFHLVMAQVILHGSPRGRVPGTEAWTRRFRQATLRLLVAGVWAVTVISLALAVAPALAGGVRPRALGWIVPASVLVAIVPFAIQLVRLTRDRTSGSDGTPDQCWKLGLFYYNPADPAVMVEKRFGVGYTLNFGNRSLWWILGSGVLAFLVMWAVLPST